jgi:hypothetical protein
VWEPFLRCSAGWFYLGDERVFNPLILLFSSLLAGCGGRCAEHCEVVDQAYIDLHARCGVEIDAAPVCDQDNLETRRCEQACLQATECAMIGPDTQVFFIDSLTSDDYFECMVGCADYESYY